MTRIEDWLARAINRITGEALGTYQAAIIRIGFSLTWLLFLVREFPHRQELYGPDGPWSWSMGRQLIEDNGAFTALIWTDSQIWFEIVYALAMVSSALLLLGWHTRAMSVLFMFGVLSLENRSIFMSDGGDNVIHLMAIYLVLTRCGAIWSLDARRLRRQAAARARGAHARTDTVGPLLWGVLGLALAVVSVKGYLSSGWSLVFWGLWVAHGLWWVVDRTASRDAALADGTPRDDTAPAVSAGRSAAGALPGGTAPDASSADSVNDGLQGASKKAPRGEARLLLDIIANLAHNAGLLVIMTEACLIYATAGWYKIQGSRWQDGTAVYYPLHLDYFSPWPALSQLLGEHGLVVLVITYGTVMMQVAFPFTLFNRRVKNVLLVGMICEHIVIAITLGLPFFSLAMIAADSVFLPTSFLQWLGAQAGRLRGAVLPRRRRTVTSAPAERGDVDHDAGALQHTPAASPAQQAPQAPDGPGTQAAVGTADSHF